MSKVLQIALGVVAALGGFVDIGDLVFNTPGGREFGYQLLWVVADRRRRDHRLLGDVRTGRAVTKRPVFDLVRRAARLRSGTRDPDRLARSIKPRWRARPRSAAIAICLQLSSPASRSGVLLVDRRRRLVFLVWVLPFEWIERVFGYGGLCLLVYVVAAVKLHPDWGEVATASCPALADGRATC